MIDLHTHILPGIDDGAADEGVSAEQLESLAAQGVDKVVFTSHYYGRKRSPRQFLEARAGLHSSESRGAFPAERRRASARRCIFRFRRRLPTRLCARWRSAIRVIC